MVARVAGVTKKGCFAPLLRHSTLHQARMIGYSVSQIVVLVSRYAYRLRTKWANTVTPATRTTNYKAIYYASYAAR